MIPIANQIRIRQFREEPDQINPDEIYKKLQSAVSDALAGVSDSPIDWRERAEGMMQQIRDTNAASPNPLIIRTISYNSLTRAITVEVMQPVPVHDIEFNITVEPIVPAPDGAAVGAGYDWLAARPFVSRYQSESDEDLRARLLEIIKGEKS